MVCEYGLFISLLASMRRIAAPVPGFDCALSDDVVLEIYIT